MENEQERRQAIEKTREWVRGQSWYKSRSHRAYVPSDDALRAYEEKYKVPYRGMKGEDKEELATREQIEIEDPEF